MILRTLLVAATVAMVAWSTTAAAEDPPMLCGDVTRSYSADGARLTETRIVARGVCESELFCLSGSDLPETVRAAVRSHLQPCVLDAGDLPPDPPPTWPQEGFECTAFPVPTSGSAAGVRSDLRRVTPNTTRLPDGFFAVGAYVTIDNLGQLPKTGTPYVVACRRVK